MNKKLSLRLEQSDATAEAAARAVLEEPGLLAELIAGVTSKNATVKFKSAKALRIVSETNPQQLYSHAEFFFGLLDSRNNIVKWIAQDIVANLTPVDAHDQFGQVFKRFYQALDEGSLVTAAHVVDNSAKIATAKPGLEPRITQALLGVRKLQFPSPECAEILAGKAITAFGGYFGHIRDQAGVIAFVKRELSSTRNATRKKAEQFLREHGLE